MAANHYDAIVIGAGHNGLIAGAYLARAGKKVAILERRDVVGGAAVTEEIFSRLSVHGVLLRGEPAAPGDHSRSRAAAPRADDPAAPEHGDADGQRRLSRAVGRSRPDAA